MRLATIRTAGGATTAVRVDDDTCIGLDAPDVGALLADPSWPAAAVADGPALGRLADASLAPVVPRPGKIICVGLNYRSHILEMGRELPAHPALFAKFAESLVGAHDPIALPAASDAVDWEAELALVIGRPVRHADDAEASAAIAGFTCMDDVTMRDWQYRTVQWLQGKTFEATSPLGPVLVTPDELPGGTRPVVELSAAVDGEVVQRASTADLVFDPVDLVRYVSGILTLQPGDVIATGTPGGVGRTPARYLRDGQILVTAIQGIGRCENRIAVPAAVA